MLRPLSDVIAIRLLIPVLWFCSPRLFSQSTTNCRPTGTPRFAMVPPRTTATKNTPMILKLPIMPPPRLAVVQACPFSIPQVTGLNIPGTRAFVSGVLTFHRRNGLSGALITGGWCLGGDGWSGGGEIARNRRTITITVVLILPALNASHRAILARDQPLLPLTQNNVRRDPKCDVWVASKRDGRWSQAASLRAHVIRN